MRSNNICNGAHVTVGRIILKNFISTLLRRTIISQTSQWLERLGNPNADATHDLTNLSGSASIY